MDLRTSTLRKQFARISSDEFTASLNKEEDETIYFSCESDGEMSPVTAGDLNNNHKDSAATSSLSPAERRTPRRRSSLASKLVPRNHFFSSTILKSPVTLQPPKKPLKQNNTTFSVRRKFKCKWCDKVFEIEKALEIRLKERCEKIPAIEKKKILKKK